MIKKWWWLFFILVAFSTSWASEQLDLTAPGGGQMDLERNIMKYNSLDSQLVEIRWKDLTIEAKYVEYAQNSEILKGKEQIKITQKTPGLRIIRADELEANLSQEYLTASQNVTLNYDQNTSAMGEQLSWDQKKDQIKISGQVKILHDDWTLTGVRIEGQLNKGLFTVYGPAEAANKSNLIKGGKMVFDRNAEKVVIQDNPVLIRDKNEMSATEITYDLKTNQILANGIIKTRIINETK